MMKIDPSQCERYSQNNAHSKSDAYMHTVFMQSPVPICIFRGSEYILEFANTFYLEILGKTANIVGKPIFESFPELKNQGLKELLETVMQSEMPYQVNEHELFMATDKGQKQCFFNCTYQPLKEQDGTISGTIVVFTEVTEQVIQRKRLAEIEQLRAKELIEAKIFAELATKIAEEAKCKAEEATLIAENAVKAKQQFLSNMSHEIRTPMNAIIGFTKVMLKTELTGKQKEYLTAVKMSGDYLIVLINDILDLAKVDAGKMMFEKTPFKLALSISAILHLFEIKIQEKNLVLIKVFVRHASLPRVFTTRLYHASLPCRTSGNAEYSARHQDAINRVSTTNTNDVFKYTPCRR